MATPATSVLAGKAGGSLVGGFHHLDELIVLRPDLSARSPKMLASGGFSLLADRSGRPGKIALPQNILLEQEGTLKGIGHAF